MEGELSDQESPERSIVTCRKAKKKLSKDVRGALKSKHKVANFIERAGKSEASNVVMDVDDLSDELEVVFDDRVNDEEMEEVSLENLSFVSNDDDVQEVLQGSDEDEVSHAASLPYMREFDIGIQYRKLNCNSILVSIEPYKNLYFAGKALVQVLKGVVDIYGYRAAVDGKKYTVFSAKGHSSLVSVKTCSRSDGGTISESQLESCGVSLKELQSLPGALVVFEGFENEWCDGMRNTYPEAAEMIGPSITGIGPGRLPQPKQFMEKLGFQFVKRTSSIANRCRLLEFPPYWDNIFTDLTTQFDCASGKVCPFGGKGFGKSTFVKWLANRYLSRPNTTEVLFIDLDPGQTEFTPPGMISAHVCDEPILGPNFTHLKDPVRAIYLGTISVADFPISYIKGVAELYEYCASNERFQGMPWVINTMGFSQGLGVHIACEIIKIMRPNCVIQLNIENDRRSFPFFLNKDNVSNHRTFLSTRLSSKYHEPLEHYNFLSVRSACNRERGKNTNTWGPNARTLREMVLISYFADKIGLAEGFSIRSVVPLRVPLDSIAIGTNNSDLSYDKIISSLNGNLVALCEMSESHFQTMEEGSQKRFITNAAEFTNNCLGYGIVRGFDKQSETLYVITPVQETDILLKVNVILAAGAIGLPLQFYVNSSTSSVDQEVPYLMSRREGTSTLHAAARKFFVPKKVTHNVLKNCLL